MENRAVIVIDGSPVDGYNFTGPFESAEHASEWAENNIKEQSWWTAFVDTPEDRTNV